MLYSKKMLYSKRLKLLKFIYWYIEPEYKAFKSNKTRKNYNRLVEEIEKLKIEFRILLHENPNHIIYYSKNINTYDKYINNMFECNGNITQNCIEAEQDGVSNWSNNKKSYITLRIGSTITGEFPPDNGIYE